MLSNFCQNYNIWKSIFNFSSIILTLIKIVSKNLHLHCIFGKDLNPQIIIHIFPREIKVSLGLMEWFISTLKLTRSYLNLFDDFWQSKTSSDRWRTFFKIHQSIQAISVASYSKNLNSCTLKRNRSSVSCYSLPCPTSFYATVLSLTSLAASALQEVISEDPPDWFITLFK